MNSAITVKLLAIIESLRLCTSLLIPAVVYIGGLIASGSLFSMPLFIAMTSFFLLGAGSMPLNDYFDRKIDAIVHPERPIPSKRVKPIELLSLSLIFFTCGLLLSLFINIICFLLVCFTLLFIYLYERLFKKMGFAGNIIVAFLSSMSFIFGSAAVGNPFASIFLSIIAFLLFTGREILKDVEDVKGDVGIRQTLPLTIGEKNAAIIGSLFIIGGALVTPIPYLLNQLSIGYLLSIFLVDIIGLYAVLKTLQDLKHTTKTVCLLRIASGLGIFSFLIGTII
jgi:geranylgeranylglycerol-phosphate geranylgeranyltransferase